MEIHKPKAWHGWREFAKEVGIIVLGILIALGLEQAVAWAHDRAVAREARESLRLEIAGNLRSIALRTAIEPCIQRRLREVDAYLDAVETSGAPKPPTWIGAPYSFLTSHTRFQAAQSAGRFVLLSPAEQEEAARIYADLDDFNEANVREWYAWSQLRSLATLHGKPEGADIARLRGALQEARAADWFARLDDAEISDHAAKIGLKIPAVAAHRYQAASVCLAIDTPYAQGAAKAGGRVPFPE